MAKIFLAMGHCFSFCKVYTACPPLHPNHPHCVTLLAPWCACVMSHHISKSPDGSLSPYIKAHINGNSQHQDIAGLSATLSQSLGSFITKCAVLNDLSAAPPGSRGVAGGSGGGEGRRERRRTGGRGSGRARSGRGRSRQFGRRCIRVLGRAMEAQVFSRHFS